MSVDRWMDKEDVAHIHNGILLSHKKKRASKTEMQNKNRSQKVVEVIIHKCITPPFLLLCFPEGPKSWLLSWREQSVGRALGRQRESWPGPYPHLHLLEDLGQEKPSFTLDQAQISDYYIESMANTFWCGFYIVSPQDMFRWQNIPDANIELELGWCTVMLFPFCLLRK